MTIVAATRAPRIGRDRARRIVFWFGVSAFAVTMIISLFYSPLDEIARRLKVVAPWVFAGLVLTEAAWIGGAALMAYGAGRRIRNPLKLKAGLSEFGKDGRDVRLFKIGLLVNTGGAIGTAVVIAVGVIFALPLAVWPSALLLVALDVAVTAVVRIAMFEGLPALKGRPASPGPARKDGGSR